MTTTPAEIFQRLLAHFGPQQRWPAATRFEILVGTILTPSTSWQNVRQALDNLREAAALDPQTLLTLPDEELAELIRPAGHVRLKARRLRGVLTHLAECYGGSLEAMFATDMASLRGGLLSINGVGPETADSILLYAGQLPSFVVDIHTERVLKRHGWIEFEADYPAIQEYFESSLEREPTLYQEYHALLVRVGNEHCRKMPKCEGCPLAELLPESGPLEPPEF